MKSRIEIIDLHLKMKMNKEKIKDITNQAAAKFIQMIQDSNHLSLPVASDLGTLLIGAESFSNEQREEILNELNKRMSWCDEPESPEAPEATIEVQGSPPKAKLQVCLTFYKFWTKRLWVMAMNLEFTMNCCAQQISLFARKIGLNNPNEKTCRNAIAALAAARLKAYGQTADAFTLLMAVRCFKDSLRKSQHVIHGPTEYPDSPIHLHLSNPSLFQSAYSDEPWVEVPHLSWEEIEMQSVMTPCRGTMLALCGGGGSRIPRRTVGLIADSAYSNQRQIILPDIDVTGRNPRRDACEFAAIAETSTCCEDVSAISWTPLPTGAVAPRQNSAEIGRSPPPTGVTQVNQNGTKHHGGQVSQPTHSDTSSDKSSQIPEDKLKQITDNAKRLAEKGKEKKKSAKAEAAAGAPVAFAKAKAKGKAKAKAKAKAKVTKPKTKKEKKAKGRKPNWNRRPGKNAPGCSKCRYLARGCRNCNPARFQNRKK